MAKAERGLYEYLWSNLEYIQDLKDTTFATDVLRARRDFLRLRRKEEREIAGIYVRAADRVAADIRKIKPDASKLTRRHWVQMEISLRREAEAIANSLDGVMKSGTKTALNIGARATDYQLARAIQESGIRLSIPRIERGFARVNTAAVEAFWARSRHGMSISDRIWKVSQKSRDSIRDILQTGIAMGRDPVQVARDLERYVRRGEGTLAMDYRKMMARMGKRIPKKLNYEALRLVRTEYSNAFREGLYSRGRTSPSYLGVKWMLAESHDVEDVCDELAKSDLYGMGPGIYPKGEEPVTPHPNCRCDTIPHLEDTDEFVDRLMAWSEEPTSQPDIDEWYHDFYLQVLER